MKKQAAVPAAPQLGLDVELGQQGHASAMPRLPFASGALPQGSGKAAAATGCLGLPVHRRFSVAWLCCAHALAAPHLPPHLPAVPAAVHDDDMEMPGSRSLMAL